jgi:hypothetical protein
VYARARTISSARTLTHAFDYGQVRRSRPPTPPTEGRHGDRTATAMLRRCQLARALGLLSYLIAVEAHHSYAHDVAICTHKFPFSVLILLIPALHYPTAITVFVIGSTGRVGLAAVKFCLTEATPPPPFSVRLPSCLSPCAHTRTYALSRVTRTTALHCSPRCTIRVLLVRPRFRLEQPVYGCILDAIFLKHPEYCANLLTLQDKEDSLDFALPV